MPEHQHPIDPLSERLGELRADVRGIRERLDGIDHRLDGIDHRLDRTATTAELRVWGGLLVLLVGAMLGKLWGVLG